MNRFSSNSGWTMIELVLVIAILGALTAAAFAYFFDLAGQAEIKTESYTIGSIQEGIDLQHAADIAGH